MTIFAHQGKIYKNNNQSSNLTYNKQSSLVSYNDTVLDYVSYQASWLDTLEVCYSGSGCTVASGFLYADDCISEPPSLVPIDDIFPSGIYNPNPIDVSPTPTSTPVPPTATPTPTASSTPTPTPTASSTPTPSLT